MEEKEDEISVIKLFEKIVSWLSYFRSKWIFIFLFGIFGAGIGLLYAWLAKPEYTAELTFVLSTSDSKTSTLAGLAGQFGIDLGSSNDVFAGDNIIGLMTSKRMVEQALLKKTFEKESLLNLFARTTKLDKRWNGKDRTKGAYPFPDSLAKFSSIQDSLIKEVYGKIVKDVLSVSKPDKKQSIYLVKVTSNAEIFSVYLSKYLVESTTKFYIDTKTKSSRLNLSMIQREADSLKNLLGGSIVSTASETDRTFNLNPAYQVQRSIAQQSQVKATVFIAAYGEVIKNLELAKISLQKDTPLFQVIDEPGIPLKAVKIRKLFGVFIGGLIAVIFCFSMLILKRVKDRFNSLNNRTGFKQP